MDELKMLTVSKACNEVAAYCKKNNIQSLFLIARASLEKMAIQEALDSVLRKEKIKVIRFLDFEPNPRLESVEKARIAFKKSECDAILAIGGGSAIDVAKCVKLYAKREGVIDLSHYQEESMNKIPFIVIPTTAGSGSEATKYAVIYKNEKKQSIANQYCMPTKVLFVPSLLQSLPEHIKKASLLDALCHCIEALWSIHSTLESDKIAKKAIAIILGNTELYLRGEEKANAEIMYASYLAGRTIDITQTTAAHAMAYKVTGLYEVPHGHAVSLCIVELLRYMLEHLDDCNDVRGKMHVESSFLEIARLWGAESKEEASDRLEIFIQSIKLPKVSMKLEDLETLVESVNVQRLQNNPILLNDSSLEKIYRSIIEVNN